MINFDRDVFDGLTTEQKTIFVNDLVKKNTKLIEKEIHYLVPENKEKYFHNRIKTSDWLEDYEFEAMTDEYKEIYIWNKRFLQKADLKRLPINLQKEYISKTINSGVQLSPGEFDILANDDLRRYYVHEKIKYAIDTTFTTQELYYLNAHDQIEYLNTLIKSGLAPNTDEFLAFKPEALRYYQTHRTMNEIKSIIRQELTKILS